MSFSAPLFELSNALGDGMVLQRAPQRALTWGFGTPGSSVAVTLGTQRLPPVLIGADGVWRRKFASGTSVSFDTHGNYGNISWAQPSPSPSPSPSPPSPSKAGR